MALADELLSPGFVSHDWPTDGPVGPQAFRNYYAARRKALPDARHEVDDLIAEGDRVAVRWRMLGTYENGFPGIPLAPTGKPVTLRGVAIYRVADGKLAERWVVSDVHGLIEQARGSSCH